MLLNSNQITNYVVESPFSKRAQVGIDLSVSKIESIEVGSVVYKDKTNIDPSGYKEMGLTLIDGKKCWALPKGVYSVTFNEGIKVPADCAAIITHRSSLYRTGTIINSPWWDPGFYCDIMNTTMVVTNKIIIEENARIAQIVFWRLEEVGEQYGGTGSQWQGLNTAYKK
jgi:deoxycytidine triphosphate deaminase